MRLGRREKWVGGEGEMGLRGGGGRNGVGGEEWGGEGGGGEGWGDKRGLKGWIEKGRDGRIGLELGDELRLGGLGFERVEDVEYYGLKKQLARF